MIKNIIMAAAGAGGAPVVVATPSIVVPLSTLTSYGNIMVLGSAYSQTSGVLENISAMQLQVSTVSGFSSVNFDSGIVAVSSPRLDINMTVVPDGLIYMRVRYRSSSGIWSNWSNPSATTLTKVYFFNTATNDGSIVVPAGKTQAHIQAWGCHGGVGDSTDNAGGGGVALGTINVTSGQTLKIVVGNNHMDTNLKKGFGGNFYSGLVSCGGGLSGVYLSNDTPMIIAAGGGGWGLSTYGGSKTLTSVGKGASAPNNEYGVTKDGAPSESEIVDAPYRYISGCGGGGYLGGRSGLRYSTNGGSGGQNYASSSATNVSLYNGITGNANPAYTNSDYSAVGGITNKGVLGVVAVGLVLIKFT